MQINTRMLIDGELVDGADTLDVTNPATAAPFITVARADAEQLDKAVAAAKAAAPAWAALGWEARGALLSRLADALEAQRDEMARLLTTEQGKPIRQATGGVDFFHRH